MIERNHAQLLPTDLAIAPEALVAAAFVIASSKTVGGSGSSGTSPAGTSTSGTSPSGTSPWDLDDGWRANLTARRTLALQWGEVTHQVHIDYRRAGLVIEHAGVSSLVRGSVDGRKVCLTWNGVSITAQVAQVREVQAGHAHNKLYTFLQGRRFDLELHDPLIESETGEEERGGLTAPMPGKILAVLVAAGSRVEKGAPLVVMEAMKMEHTIAAPSNGRVTAILHAVGDQVAEGAALIAFEAAVIA